MRSRSALAAVLAVLALVGTACSGGSDDDGASSTTKATTTTTEVEVEVPEGAVETTSIAMTDEGFDPPVIVVAANSPITFTNTGEGEHSAVAGDDTFDTGPLPKDLAMGIAIAEPGIYEYGCEIHPEHTGTIAVIPA